MKQEPVVIILGGFAVLFAAAVSLTDAFGWTGFTTAQTAAAISVVTVACGLLSAAIRGQVYSPKTHEGAVRSALYTPVPLFEPEEPADGGNK